MGKKKTSHQKTVRANGEPGIKGNKEPDEVLPPVRGWRIAFLVASTVGLCLSADLLRLHINVHTDPNYQSYCAMSERVNCDTVALSSYAVFLGMPLCVWGLFGYLVMGSLAVWSLLHHRRGKAWPFGIIFALSAFSAATGVVLFFVSHFIVESVCLVCAGTYLVNIGLFILAFQALRRVGVRPLGALNTELKSIRERPKSFGIFSLVFLTLLIAVWAVIPPYWRVEAAASNADIPFGDTEEGHPWIGAERPQLTVTEYSDYQCPHCRRGHDQMRDLVVAYPEQARLVHRHYPLDHHCNETMSKPYHPNACEYARLSYCAQQQGKFWKANDYLFENGRRRDPVTPEELAEATGLQAGQLTKCFTSTAATRAIQTDLAAGRALNIRGTPTFVIDGAIYPGRVPPEVLTKALGLTETQNNDAVQE